MRNTAVGVTDPMDMMQSVSRSGGDGAEGDAWVFRHCCFGVLMSV